MTARLIHLDDVPLESQDNSSGWSISQFRLPITGRDGSASALFHGRFHPGSQHATHLHTKADELCMYLGGEGLVGAGEDRLRIGPGCARLMPKDVPHFFHNASVAGPAEVFGIYVGATDVAASGYVYCGMPTSEDLARCERPAADPLRYPVVRIADAEPYADADLGWRRAEYRPLLANSNQPAAFCFHAKVAAGGARAAHRIDNADTYYLVHAGAGVAGADGRAAPLRAGHVWWVPAGTSSWLRNDDPAEPLELYGYQVGAARPSDLAYRYEGEAPARSG